MKYITVDEDRYGGAYSEASYTAWIGEKPDEIDAGDGTCKQFWEKDYIDCVFGKGETQQDAVIDLLNKTEVWIANFDVIDLEYCNSDKVRIIIVQSEYMKKWCQTIWDEIHYDRSVNFN